MAPTLPVFSGSFPSARRGAVSDPANRFEKLSVELEPGEVVEDAETRPTRYLRDPARSVLTRNRSPDVGFEWSLNPYRGCSHGCVYCYARPTHEYLGFSAGLDFESRILVKEDAPALLRRALSSRSWRPTPLVMSGVTDPYQPGEGRLRVTRGCLEVLEACGHPVEVITKSRQVVRDTDLLASLARRNAAHVTLSITTLHRRLQRALEPRASPPEQRLDAIRRLTDAGVPVAVNVAPIIPGLTDHELPSILEAAAGAGATAAGRILLRLPWGVKELFADWLERHAPDRARRVLNRIRESRSGRLNDPNFGTRMGGTGEYAEQLQQFFKLSCRRLGLERRTLKLSGEAFVRPPPPDRTPPSPRAGGRSRPAAGGAAQLRLPLALALAFTAGCTEPGPVDPGGELRAGFIQSGLKARADRSTTYRNVTPADAEQPDLQRSWRTENGTVLHAAGDSAVIRHLEPGPAWVCADLAAGEATASACLEIQVFPRDIRLTGAFQVAGGAVPPGLHLVAEHAFGVDSAAVREDGGVVLHLPPEADGTPAALFLREAGSVDPATLLPSWRPRFRVEDFRTITGVLVPARWTIREGPWAGMEFPVDPDILTGFFAPLDREAHPFSTGNHLGMEYGYLNGRMVPEGSNAGLVAAVFGWADFHFPLPIYLERGGHPQGRDFTPGDSSAIWEGLREVEERVGRSLFRPAQAGEVPIFSPGTGNDPPLRRGVAIRSHPMTFGGLATVTTESAGPMARRQVASGSIVIHPERFAPEARDVLHRTVGHEILHILGLGHSCLVPSVMRYPCHAPGGDDVQIPFAGLGGEAWWDSWAGPPVMSPVDVWVLELRDALLAKDFAFGEREPDFSFFEAHEGYRVFVTGAGPMEDPLRYPFTRPVPARPEW